MKRLLAMFVLTPREQRLVILVVLLLAASAYYKHHRDLKLSGAPRAVETATPALSPSPSELDAASPRRGGLKPPTN